MINIPPHYTDRFIVQRYNKALHFVQHLPATSNFQPTKSQKLELYSLYKQVSQGDINTQRPGLFDVVGRAKWDAWKKLEGISVLEARHIYVEALLRVATEAYKKNLGREEAQQIIHTFAIMRPSGDDDESDDIDTDDTSNQEEETEDDEDSSNAEEQAYLRAIQSSSNSSSFQIVNSHAPDRQQLTSPVLSRYNNRPSSVASIQTMVTAPTTRSPSVATSTRSTRLGRGNEKRSQQQHMTREDVRHGLPDKDSFNDEELDNSVNPWQHVSTDKHTSSEDSIEHGRSYSERQRRTPSSSHHLRLPSPMYRQQRTSLLASSSPPLYPQQLQSMTVRRMSPVPGSSASSSVTATPQLNQMARDQRVYSPNDSRSTSRNQSYSNPPYSSSVIALGPATKRALESLQNEIIALNERIDDLRKELFERDKQRVIKRKSDDEIKEEDDDYSDDYIDDGWKWVIKAAVKYAGVNLLTGFILFFILYKSGSPIAYAILKQTGKYWHTFKLRVLISNMVV